MFARCQEYICFQKTYSELMRKISEVLKAFIMFIISINKIDCSHKGEASNLLCDEETEQFVHQVSTV